MKATILVYSGKPDPHWLLKPDEGKQLYEQLRVLPGTLMKIDHPSLGYRGIRVGLDATEVMTIYKGIVEVISNGDEVRRFLDYNRELEEWIFKTSLSRIDDAVFTQLTMSEFYR